MISFNKVDIVFFVEHLDRELESINRLAEHLQAKGLSSVILSAFYHPYLLVKISPKVIVFPYMLSRRDWPTSLAWSLYGDAVSYINLNWEQLLSPVNLVYKRPGDEFTKKSVLHIAWTEQFSFYLQDCGVAQANIHTCGNMSAQILEEMLGASVNLRGVLSNKYHIDSAKNWLFFPENYGWAFSSDRDIVGKIRKGFPAEVAWEYREYSKKCLVAFISFISDISAQYSFEIIIRPHPSITIDDYKNAFSSCGMSINENIHIVKGNTARDWLIASDLIGSSWSTVVYDAASIGKRNFLFTPYPRPKWLNVYWNDMVPNISDASEIHNVGSSFLENQKIPDPISAVSSVIEKQVDAMLGFAKPRLFSCRIGVVVLIKFFRSFLYCRNMFFSKKMQYDKIDPIYKNVHLK